MSLSEKLKLKQNLDMTSGSIPRLLISFAAPLLIGNLFQQLYNMVDTWVLGNFATNEAFSAVGSVSNIIYLMISLAAGLGGGAGIVVSQYYGAKDDEGLSRISHTAMFMTLFISIGTTIVGLALIDPMLELMNMPASVAPDAKTYLFIIDCGLAGTMYFNMGAAILRAIGDSVRPFIYGAVCAVLNIFGDLLLVIRFDMGVAGVALATVISQAVSAVLVIIALARSSTAVRLSMSRMHIHRGELVKTLKLGIPSALQMGIISFSNVFVQGYINYFGPNVMSGWTAYSKVDALLLLPLQSLCMAVSTFSGQNIGIGNEERARRGVRIGYYMCLIANAVPLIPVMIFAPQIVAFFNAKPEVVEYGSAFLRWISPFYLLSCSCDIESSGLRGAGDVKWPVTITIFSYVVFRQIYLYLMANYISNTVLPIAMGYPAGWMVCAVLMFIHYRRVDMSRYAVTNRSSSLT